MVRVILTFHCMMAQIVKKELHKNVHGTSYYSKVTCARSSEEGKFVSLFTGLIVALKNYGTQPFIIQALCESSSALVTSIKLACLPIYNPPPSFQLPQRSDLKNKKLRQTAILDANLDDVWHIYREETLSSKAYKDPERFIMEEAKKDTKKKKSISAEQLDKKNPPEETHSPAVLQLFQEVKCEIETLKTYVVGLKRQIEELHVPAAKRASTPTKNSEVLCSPTWNQPECTPSSVTFTLVNTTDYDLCWVAHKNPIYIFDENIVTEELVAFNILGHQSQACFDYAKDTPQLISVARWKLSQPFGYLFVARNLKCNEISSNTWSCSLQDLKVTTAGYVVDLLRKL
jgi:hypothetical protein